VRTYIHVLAEVTDLGLLSVNASDDHYRTRSYFLHLLTYLLKRAKCWLRNYQSINQSINQTNN